MYDTDRSGKFYLWLNQIGVYVIVLNVVLTNAGLRLPFSHSSHSVPPKAAEAGADQRLPTDGGGVHQEPGADEASGGKTGGESLLYIYLTYLCPVYLGLLWRQ